MFPNYVLNKRFLQFFIGLVFFISSLLSIFLSNNLSKKNEYQRFLNGQASYILLINQKLNEIEDEISFLSSKKSSFEKVKFIDFSNKNIELIFYKPENKGNFKEKFIWKQITPENTYLSQIFFNSSSAIIEASKKFPGKPLYGSVINFPENKMLPIVFTIKTEPNAFETIVIWLHVEPFITDINLEFKKRFNLPLKMVISETHDYISGFFIENMPNLNLLIKNTINTHSMNFFGLKLYYNTLIVGALNVIIAALFLALIGQTFTKFSSDNFKYLSFWNQEIKNKLLSVKEISSSIAHELNQPLAAAEIYVSTLKNELSKEFINKEEVLNISNSITQQISRCSNIIKSMSALSKNSFDKMNSHNLKSLFDDLKPLIMLQANEYNSVVEIDIDESLYIFVDKVAFEQIVLNISRNAFQAMNKKNHKDNLLKISVHVSNKTNNLFTENKLALIFSDNGAGIQDKIGDSIFDPFYSNKSDGAGLGLNIVKSLVEQNKGSISFINNTRGGTDFIIRLPKSNKERTVGNDNIN